MDVIKTMSPGMPGTKRFYEKWGDSLVAVRYRNDPDNNRRITTIEICVDQRPINGDARKKHLPPKANHADHSVRLASAEYEFKQVKTGNHWQHTVEGGYLADDVARIFGLERRVLDEEIAD